VGEQTSAQWQAEKGGGMRAGKQYIVKDKLQNMALLDTACTDEQLYDVSYIILHLKMTISCLSKYRCIKRVKVSLLELPSHEDSEHSFKIFCHVCARNGKAKCLMTGVC
jgi:hypothetical protein